MRPLIQCKGNGCALSAFLQICQIRKLQAKIILHPGTVIILIFRPFSLNCLFQGCKFRRKAACRCKTCILFFCIACRGLFGVACRSIFHLFRGIAVACKCFVHLNACKVCIIRPSLFRFFSEQVVDAHHLLEHLQLSFFLRPALLFQKFRILK